MKPVLLDLFAGAGGATQGYRDAGFTVIAVDNSELALKRNPAPETYASDWLWAAQALVGTGVVDVIHASPPCQAYSITKHTHSTEHPELIEPVREFLQSTGLPYVIENVVGAPMIDPVVLDGTMFGLTTRDPATNMTLYLLRRRQFESNVPLTAPHSRVKAYRARSWQCGGVYGGGSRNLTHARTVRHGGYTPSKPVQERLMGINWMTQKQLNQAIPPAYTKHVGAQLLAHLGAEVAA